jgi:ferredoxin
MGPHGNDRQVKTKRSIDAPKREETHRTINDNSPGERPIKSTPSPNFTVLIDNDLCFGCGMCVDICSVCAITMRDDLPVVGEGCIACGLCAQQCPNNAITLVPEKRTTQEV